MEDSCACRGSPPVGSSCFSPHEAPKAVRGGYWCTIGSSKSASRFYIGIHGVYIRIMENQMEKKMDNEMEAEIM